MPSPSPQSEVERKKRKASPSRSLSLMVSRSSTPERRMSPERRRRPPQKQRGIPSAPQGKGNLSAKEGKSAREKRKLWFKERCLNSALATQKKQMKQK